MAEEPAGQAARRLEIKHPLRYTAWVFLSMMGITTVGVICGILDDIGTDAVTFYSLGTCIAAAESLGVVGVLILPQRRPVVIAAMAVYGGGLLCFAAWFGVTLAAGSLTTGNGWFDLLLPVARWLTIGGLAMVAVAAVVGWVGYLRGRRAAKQ